MSQNVKVLAAGCCVVSPPGQKRSERKWNLFSIRKVMKTLTMKINLRNSPSDLMWVPNLLRKEDKIINIAIALRLFHDWISMKFNFPYKTLVREVVDWMMILVFIVNRKLLSLVEVNPNSKNWHEKSLCLWVIFFLHRELSIVRK